MGLADAEDFDWQYRGDWPEGVVRRPYAVKPAAECQ
jgi:hypothetical protein